MRHLSVFMRKYLFELVIAILISTVIVIYPYIAPANLFLLIALILFQYLLSLGARKQSIIGALLLIISVILYYYFLQNSLSYLFIACGTIYLVSLIYFIWKRGFNLNQKNILLKTMIVGLVVIVLQPVLFFVSQGMLQNKYYEDMQKSAQAINNDLNQKMSLNIEHSDKIAQDIFIKQLIESKRFQDLLEYSQNVMVTNDKDLLVVCDLDDKVIARADNPKNLGDDCGQLFGDWQDSQSETQIIDYSTDHFLVSSSDIVAQDGTKIAKIFTGNSLKKAISSSIEDIWFISFGEDLLSKPKNSEQQKIITALNKTEGLKNGTSVVNYDGKKILTYKDKTFFDGILITIAKEFGDYQQLLFINILLTTLLCIAGIVIVRLYYPHQVIANNREKSIFNKSQRKHKYAEIVTEVSVFSIIILLISWQSFIKYYQYDMGSETKNAEIISPDLEPYLSLSAPNYISAGNLFTFDLNLRDLGGGVDTISAAINYDSSQIEIKSIDTENGFCDVVFDKSINKNQGVIIFSCVTKDLETNTLTDINLAQVSAILLKPGFNYLVLDKDYAKISTFKGISTKVTQNTIFGECVLGQ